MSEIWGSWNCPYDGCDERNIQDPSSIFVTCCGNGHTVLLGFPENGYRWAEKYVPSDVDVQLAFIEGNVYRKSEESPCQTNQ